MDARGAGAGNTIWCEIRFSLGSGLIDAAVRVEELLAGFDVPSGKEDHGKGRELETIIYVREATRK